MAQVRLWAVIGAPDRAKHWTRLLERGGWSVSRCDARSLLDASRPAGVGLALIDRPELGPAAAAAVSSLRSRHPDMPLILTSESPLDNAEVISLLEAGIDDYLPETLDFRLILAKLSSHLRRLLPALQAAFDVLVAPQGDLRLDRGGRALLVKDRNGRWKEGPRLTAMEFDLLALFLERPAMVLERGFLMENANAGGDVRPATIDKHVEALRRKLGARGSRIKTIYGSGYVFKGGA